MSLGTSKLKSLVVRQLPSEHCDERDPAKGGDKIDTIIIHTMHNSLGGDPFDPILCKGVLDREKVSTHYLVDRNGEVLCCVPEEKRAWHAGVSKMPGDDGREGVNHFSIGIEMIADFDDGLTEAQYDVLSLLVKDIKSRRPEIKNILGHSDVAPGRKTDPWNFDWDRLLNAI